MNVKSTRWDWKKHREGGHWELIGNNGEVICDDGSAWNEYAPKIDPKGPHGCLIAAAPELLEALRELDECYCEAGGPSTAPAQLRHEHRQTLIKARAAIQRATGSQP